MKKTTLLISFIFFMCYTIHAQNMRSMYVDGFNTILGNDVAENELLTYAKSHEIKILLLYDLYLINVDYNLTNAKTNTILANFIRKAKTNYGVLYVGATGENAIFFTNTIDPYNNSRSDSLEKIDIYNLEFEFWNAEAIKSTNRKYYWDTYLKPNGLPCTIDGAFQYSISVLKTMNSLAKNNTHPITIEAYVSEITDKQIRKIAPHVNRLLLCSYKNNTKAAFVNSKKRIKAIANSNLNIEISILFSSELGYSYMGKWLGKKGMIATEKEFVNYLKKEPFYKNKNINLVGFTYFSYSNCKAAEISLN